MTALKTLTLRLRGAKTELEDASLDMDNMAESTSQLQKKLLALTHGKVDIMIDNQTFKNTTEILREMSAAWQDMTDIERASALELMGGKRQANILSSIIKNFDTVDQVIQSSLNSENSAFKENEKYLDSIDGKIKQFTNSLQTFWMDAISSDFVKGIVDIGTTLLNILDEIVKKAGIVFPAIGILITKHLIKNLTAANDVKGLSGLFGLIKNIPVVQNLIKTLSIDFAAIQMGATAASSGLTGFSKIIAGLKGGLSTLIAGINPVVAGFAALAAIVTIAVIAYNKFGPTHKNFVKQLEEQTEELENVRSELKSLNSELETTKQRMDELENKGSLSYVEEQELAKLKETNDELDRQIKLEKARESRALEKQLTAANNAAKTDSNFQDQYNATEDEYYYETPEYAAAHSYKTTNVGNKYDQVLANLEDAQKKLKTTEEEYLTALNDNTVDENSKEFKQLKKNYEDAQAEVQKYNQELDNLQTNFEETYGDVGYQEILEDDSEALKAQKEQWNEFYRQQQMYLNKQGLLNGTLTKADVLNSVFGKFGSEAAKTFNESFDSEIEANNFKDLADGTKYAQEWMDNLKNTSPQLAQELESCGITAEDVAGYFMELGEYTAETVENIGTTIASFDEITSSIESYNEIQKQTEEIIMDNMEVTQEYKDSLIELVGSEDKVNECFYDSNKLVVKNAKQLNALVKSTKNNIANNIKLAKSQAQINYYSLYKQLRQLTNGQKIEDTVTLNHVNSLYKEMGAIQKTIARYSLLEQQLSSVIQTYNEFDEAQTTDSDHDYMSKVETMITSLIQAYETSDLGTETAQVAMKALIPEVEFEGLDTAEEKAKAAHDYIMETLNKYFVLDFDEETGEIQSAEMKLGNLRKFIEDGMVDNKVFAGSDWMHFEFSDKFLDGLDEADDKLQYFADQMGVTKEVALAVIQEINNKDIEWLNGDYGSLFDQIVPETLDSRLQNTTSKLAELNVQLANGKITEEQYEAAVGGLNAQLANGTITQDQYNTKIVELNKQLSDGKITQEEYTRQVSGLNGQLIEQKTNAVNVCTAFMDLNDKIDESQEKIEKYQKQLSSGTDENGNKLTDEQIDEINQQYQKELKNYESYVKQKKDLEDKYGVMTEYTVSIALEENGIDVDNIDSELSKTKDDINSSINKLNKSLDGLEVSINDDGEIEYRITDKTEESQLNHLKELGALNDDGTVNIDLLYSGLTDEQKSEVDNLKTLQSKLNLINYYLGMDGVDTVQTSIDKLVTTLENIYKLLETSPTFSANVSQETKTTLDGLVDKVGSWVGDHWANFKATVSSIFGGGESGAQKSEGTAHVSGTAHKSGNWGLPEDEKDALVGELGEETIVNPYTGRYYTVGTNGAELVDIPKGAIIFNHKQTEELFKNGHINSRGKVHVNGNAHAEGNAHVTIYPKETVKSQWEGTGYSSWDDATYDAADALQSSADSLSDASDSLSDATDAFEDTINWIEVLFTRIDDILSEHEAYLATIVDSTGGLSTKNSIYDTMFGQMYYKANSSLQAAEYYRAKAEQEMAGLSADIQNKIRNGTIDIQEFKGTGNEESDKALEEYVDKINKAIEYYDQISQYMQQYYSTIEEIADKALERLEETATAYENEIGLVEHLNETLEARNDLLEAKEGFATEAYYKAQISANNTMLKQYQAERKALQQVLDAEVAAGRVQIGSQQWFDMQSVIYDCDDATIDMEASIEDLQNAINDLYWDKFDELINRFGYLEDELSNVIELLSHDPDGLIMEELRDLTTTNWATGSGLASLGLYAQQMEEAQYVANQYAEQIKELKKQYASGRYKETEYLNKLNELISAQYENIQNYYDARDAIVELNEARVDAIKTGIQEEIDAYDELISKKKELLNREQD